MVLATEYRSILRILRIYELYYRLAAYGSVGYHMEFHDLRTDLRGCLRICTLEQSIRTLQICVAVQMCIQNVWPETQEDNPYEVKMLGT